MLDTVPRSLRVMAFGAFASLVLLAVAYRGLSQASGPLCAVSSRDAKALDGLCGKRVKLNTGSKWYAVLVTGYVLALLTWGTSLAVCALAYGRGETVGTAQLLYAVFGGMGAVLLSLAFGKLSAAKDRTCSGAPAKNCRAQAHNPDTNLFVFSLAVLAVMLVVLLAGIAFSTTDDL